MSRLNVIKERLGRYTDERTNTNEKLENGAISDWTFHSDEDTAWLVERVGELLEACEAALFFLQQGAIHAAADCLRPAIAKAKGGG